VGLNSMNNFVIFRKRILKQRRKYENFV